ESCMLFRRITATRIPYQPKLFHYSSSHSLCGLPIIKLSLHDIKTVSNLKSQFLIPLSHTSDQFPTLRDKDAGKLGIILYQIPSVRQQVGILDRLYVPRGVAESNTVHVLPSSPVAHKERRLGH